MTRYTFERGHAAHYAGRIITVPDQVAQNQKAFDGKSFPAIDAPGYPWNGRAIRVRLDGEAYGLHTPGTGDMTCRAA